MDYSVKITLKKDIDNLYKCFLPEIDKTKRANIDIKKTNDRITIKVEASDAIALKARLNGIIKLLSVYERVKENE